MPENQYIIGITGHRRLPPGRVPAIAAEIQVFYRKEIARRGAENITVMSSLAEGADTLCAKLALNAGLRLAAPLPMNAPEYHGNFTETAAAEFDFLLAAADETFTVPPEEAVPAHPSSGYYYRQAGIYVVKHCDILLAVWDGTERDTADGAGTWETVKLAREMGRKICRVII